MKNFLIICCLSIPLLSWSQVEDTSVGAVSQKDIGLLFVKHFIHQHYDSCWLLFDKVTNPQLDKATFDQALIQMHQILPTEKDNVEFLMWGKKLMGDVKAPFYTYKYNDDVSKPAGFVFDVIFINDSSLLVAGFQPKGRAGESEQAATSKGAETVISTREEIKIDGKKYAVRGINIVHFGDDSGLISIQVEQEIPVHMAVNELKEWAYNNGLKFAKWLYRSDHYQDGVRKAADQNRTLLEELGVSFINPNTGQGYNIMIKKQDYE